MRASLGLFLCTTLYACDLFFPPKNDKPTDRDQDGYSADQDCDDDNPDVHPNADEYCDEVDWDCDGEVADSHAVDATVYYADVDNDGRGDPISENRSCTPVEGHVTDATDCDDTTPRVSPDVVEVCDGLDNDCDDEIDEDDAVDAATWRRDSDADGFGTDDVETNTIVSCTGPDGHADNGDDCDDTDATVHPEAIEQWYDGVDQDCSGGSDHDADGDGHDHIDQGGTDCQDEDPTVHPEAAEVCNDGIDNDCDGTPNACGIHGDVDLGDAGGLIVGHSASDQIGFAISSAGDVNGDGATDVLIDARYADDGGDNAGAIYVVLGPLSAGETDVDAAEAQLLGESEDDEAGTAMASLGDLNGDGYGDIVVSANVSDIGSTLGGAAYVLYGPLAGHISLSDADARLYGEETGALLGSSLTAVSDVGEVGIAGLAIGVPGATMSTGMEISRTGAIAVFAGDVLGELDLNDADLVHGENDQDWAGWALASGDFSGDGLGDLVIGAPGYNPLEITEGTGMGKAYVLAGPGFGYSNMDAAVWSVSGLAVNDNLGCTVRMVGDVDGDGHTDLLIGASGADEETGAAYLFRGGDIPTEHSTADDAVAVYLGSAAGDRVGDVVASAGDLDSDGQIDLAFGSPNHSGDPGSMGPAGLVWVVEATATGIIELGTDADAWLYGEDANDATGSSVVGIGDTDGDGYGDLLVGAPSRDSSRIDVGAVYLLFGGSL